MSDHREFPPSSRNGSTTLEPGVRAARERAELTQEQVAERMNVSIHTYRPWDQGKRRPARLEQMQLLAFVVQAPIGVIWPATDDPLVAEALRLERQRGEPPGGKPARRSASTSPLDVVEPAEIVVRRLETAPVGSHDNAERAPRAETDLGIEERGSADGLGGLPPWPDEFDDEPASEQLPTDPGSESSTHETPALTPVPKADESSIDVPEVDRAACDYIGAITLRDARPVSRWQTRRVVMALGVVLAIGGVGTAVASVLGEKPVEADPSAQSVPAQQSMEREKAAARARDAVTMRVAADRGDYDVAITAARSLGDTASVERFRRAAANVLARRADGAAGRGDLRLARQRLRSAEQRYGPAPAADDVRARIRRIQRDRARRAEQRLKAARKQAQTAPQASGAVSPAATSTATPSSAGGASVNSGGTSSDAPSSASTSSVAGSGPREKTCGDGCGLGAFPSAGQEEGHER